MNLEQTEERRGDPSKGGLLRFLTTKSVIITVGLVAAGATFFGVQVTTHHDDAGAASTRTATSSQAEPSAAPSHDGQGQLRNPQVLGQVPLGGPDDLAEQIIVACTRVLNALAGECGQGYLGSCDILYELADSGSDYETYAGTCGYRYPSLEYADDCAAPQS